MAELKGNLTGTLHGSAEARDRYEKSALAHAWGSYEAYTNMDETKRKRIDEALDAVQAESMGVSAIDEFLAAHPEMDIEQNARALRRYFDEKGIRPPFHALKLEQAYEELKSDGLLVIPEKRSGR